MDDDYIQYLLVRNFSKHAADKLSDAYLKYLFLLQKSIPEQRFQELSKIAKNTVKLRKQMADGEQASQRALDQQTFRLRDLEIENLQNPLRADQSELKAGQARIKLLEAQVQESDRSIAELKKQLQKQQQENSRLQEQTQQRQQFYDYERMYEEEKQNSYALQYQLFNVHKELNQYKEFADKLQTFCKLKGDLPEVYRQLTQLIGTRTVKISATNQILPSIIALKEQIYALKSFCHLGLDLSEVNQAVRKLLARDVVMKSISMAPQPGPKSLRVFLKSNTNQPQASYNNIIYEYDLGYFCAPLIVNILSSRKAFEFNQKTSLQDVLELMRYLRFAPFVMSSCALLNGGLVDGIQVKTRVYSASQMMKIEINQSSEVCKVMSLIYKKTVNCSGVCFCFFAGGSVCSLVSCGIPIKQLETLGIELASMEKYYFDE